MSVVGLSRSTRGGRLYGGAYPFQLFDSSRMTEVKDDGGGLLGGFGPIGEPFRRGRVRDATAEPQSTAKRLRTSDLPIATMNHVPAKVPTDSDELEPPHVICVRFPIKTKSVGRGMQVSDMLPFRAGMPLLSWRDNNDRVCTGVPWHLNNFLRGQVFLAGNSSDQEKVEKLLDSISFLGFVCGVTQKKDSCTNNVIEAVVASQLHGVTNVVDLWENFRQANGVGHPYLVVFPYPCPSAGPTQNDMHNIRSERYKNLEMSTPASSTLDHYYFMIEPFYGRRVFRALKALRVGGDYVVGKHIYPGPEKPFCERSAYRKSLLPSTTVQNEMGYTYDNRSYPKDACDLGQTTITVVGGRGSQSPH